MHSVSDPYTVIDQCGLRRDLDLFVAGDLTEVGEKGITLRRVLRSSDVVTVI